ncbi:hypothetical protein [Aquimarina sediminis]|uniref:hypothetical protein n=1 Tax=Aquimarina sediminis TaxID=2070536 RepID=UPI0013E8B204|nr:hypothetical protein [Aquimarina sediminis]
MIKSIKPIVLGNFNHLTSEKQNKPGIPNIIADDGSILVIGFIKYFVYISLLI